MHVYKHMHIYVCMNVIFIMSENFAITFKLIERISNEETEIKTTTKPI